MRNDFYRHFDSIHSISLRSIIANIWHESLEPFLEKMTIHKLCKILVMKVSRLYKTNIILRVWYVFLLTKAIIWCKIVMIVYSRVNQFTRWSRAAVQNYRHITSFTAIVNESICQSKNNTGFLSTFLARTLTRSAPFISFFKLHWFSFINLGQRYNVMLYKIIFGL